MDTDEVKDQEEASGDALVEQGRTYLRRGADLFDAGEHHASHEVFEAAWLAARGGGREAEAYWWQGLVLCAGALHHRGKGNQKGALALRERALDRLGTALRLAGDVGCAGAWWVAPCEAWVAAWRAVSLDDTYDDALNASKVADPRLKELLAHGGS
ncbi:MAG: DUF309 domain-containing protein [Planctomycetota bacterium]